VWAIETYAAQKDASRSPMRFEKITWMFFESGAKSRQRTTCAQSRCVHRRPHGGALFERFDLLLTPTLPGPPAKLGVFDMNTTTSSPMAVQWPCSRRHIGLQRQRQPGHVRAHALERRGVADRRSSSSALR